MPPHDNGRGTQASGGHGRNISKRAPPSGAEQQRIRAALVVDQRLRDGQAETETVGLGGDERFEESFALLVVDAGTFVLDRQQNLRVAWLRGDGDRAPRGHRVEGVLQEIADGFGHLSPVHQGAESLVDRHVDSDLAHGSVSLERSVHDVADAHHSTFGWTDAAEVEQLADDRVRSLNLFANDVDCLNRVRMSVRVQVTPKHGARVGDGRERVADSDVRHRRRAGRGLPVAHGESAAPALPRAGACARPPVARARRWRV